MRIGLADFSRWDFHAQSVDWAPMGGSQSAACYLSRALARRGHEVFLLSGVSAPGRYDGVNCLFWDRIDREMLRSLSLDVLICVIMAGQGTALRSVLAPSTRLVLWNQHAHDQPGVAALKDPRERSSYDGFAMVSHWQLECYRQAFQIDPAAMVVLRNSIAPSFAGMFEGRSSILAGRQPVLAYTSTPFRGLDLLLDAFGPIRAAVPEARLSVFSSMKVYSVGAEQDDAAHGALYRRCRETPGVEYVGSIPQPQLALRLREAMVLAYPNTFAETSCIAVMEAMAAGCRVVTSNLGALPETAAGFGWLIPTNLSREEYLRQFVDACVTTLRQSIAAAPEAEALLRRQVAYMNEQCTWAVRAAGWEQWLQSICRRSPKSPSTVSADDAIELALMHHRAGRLADAEAIYRQVLAQFPQHGNALHLLGVVAHQLGKNEAALELIDRAIAIDASQGAYYSNRGLALAALGRTDEAIGEFHRAMALTPDAPEPRVGLTNTLMDRGRFAEALEESQRMLAQRPDDPGYLHIAGNALQQLARYDEAAAHYRRALALKPEYPEAWNNLGNSLRLLGQPEASLEAFDRAIKMRPELAVPYLNRGNALINLGRWTEAVVDFEKCRALNPRLADAHNNLGVGILYLGRPDEAIVCFRQALAIDEAHSTAWSNIIWAMAYQPGVAPGEILAEQRRWYHARARPLLNGAAPHPNDRTADRRLRIGYVSADFRDHVVARNILPLLREHDHSRFEIFCYSHSSATDAINTQLRGFADAWRIIGPMGDASVAQMIRDDRIDILVDLSLHTAGNRLLVFARRPAPVQATFAGYPAGTGLETIDYRLTDPYLDPPGLTDANYVERSIRLPDSFWCLDEAANGFIDGPPVSPLPAETNGFITFGCLNNYCKYNDTVMQAWSRVLAAVPDSRLHLMVPVGDSRQRVLKTIAAFGTDPGRISFTDRQPREDYLREYARIDVGLDTFPYNGHTTTLEALWMGVPVITLTGQTAVARAGFSQLSNLGLAELSGSDTDSFVAIAVGLASDRARLRDLRMGLRERMRQSPLTDAGRFARGIEDAYREMWRAWCEFPR
jgi:predicted O-linked N-acetylglucosamine transferase (SPINDLY family)